MQQFKESFVEGWIISKSFPREKLEIYRLISFVGELKITSNSKASKIRPNSASFVISSSVLVERNEPSNIEISIAIEIVFCIEAVDFIVVSLRYRSEAGASKIMTLFFAHHAVNRVLLENDFEAANSLRIKFVVDHHFWLSIAACKEARNRYRIVIIDR